MARGRFDGSAITDLTDIFSCGAGVSGPSRLAWGRDGKLYMTTPSGGSGSGSQDPNSYSGKVLRLNDDGSVPQDNPFVGRAGHKPEIYTLGHRNSLGLAAHPVSGEMWQSEMGPNGGDEINILKPGANYGWPIVSLGRSYPGPWQSQTFSKEGIEAPVVYWMPAISLSGMTFYTGNKLPKWKGDIFVGGQRTGEIPGTGHLERVLVNEKLEELRREALLVPLRHAHPRRPARPRRTPLRPRRSRERRRPADRAVRFAAETDDIVSAAAALTLTAMPRLYTGESSCARTNICFASGFHGRRR